MDLDDILPHVGDWNRYQHVLLWLVCLPACIPCGFAAFNQVFMDRTPDHWCKVPALVDAGWSLEQRKEASIPKRGSVYSQCEMFDLNYTAIAESGGDSSYVNNETYYETVRCVAGWEYDTLDVQSSIVIDFDLVCSKSLYPTLALSALNIGGLVGVLLFGYLNDRLGRKRNYFLCLTVEIAFGIATALAPDIIWFCIFRFMVGLTIPAILHIPFVICLEVVSPSKRTLVSFYSNMLYVAGLVGFSGIAYALQSSWMAMALATSVPFVLYYIYVFFLPESLRWLLTQGRIEEVIEILKTVSNVNGKPVPDDILNKFKETMEKQQQQAAQVRRGKRANILDLFRTPNMRVKTLIICFTWVVNETVYVGLSYYGPEMGTDPYLSFFLSSFVEIPGYILCLLLMDRLGRRLVLCFCMIISGAASISTALLPTAEAQVSILVLFLLAKCTIAGGTMIIFQFGGELYPTEVRGVGIGLAAFLGGIGLTVIPFINYLGSHWLALPIVIMGGFSVVGGLVTLRLPETMNEKLPQTLEEGEMFGKDFAAWNDTFQRIRRCLPERCKSRKPPAGNESSEMNLQQSSDNLRY